MIGHVHDFTTHSKDIWFWDFRIAHFRVFVPIGFRFCSCGSLIGPSRGLLRSSCVLHAFVVVCTARSIFVDSGPAVGRLISVVVGGNERISLQNEARSGEERYQSFLAQYTPLCSKIGAGVVSNQMKRACS